MTDPMSRVVETRYGPAPTQPPLVSVLMITYNHEAFIREAIESVFMQEVDFPVELVIGEDCSTDGTRAVIEEVCQHAPFPVRLLTSARNVGMHENFRRTLWAARGTFVALLEGDDYWTFQGKLAEQSERMQSRFIDLSYHQVNIVRESDDDIRTLTGEVSGEPWPPVSIAPTDWKDLLDRIAVPPTSSVMFRRELFPTLPKSFKDLPWCDFPLHLIFFRFHKVEFNRVAWSTYRIHGAGVTSGMISQKFEIALSKTYFAVRTGELTGDRLLENVGGEWLIRYLERRLNDRRAFIATFRELLGFILLYKPSPTLTKRLIANYMKLYFPRLYSAGRRLLHAMVFSRLKDL